MQRKNDMQAKDRENAELRERIKLMEDEQKKMAQTMDQLNMLAAEVRSERGSSTVRVRQTQQQRTEEWLRMHGVQELFPVPVSNVEGGSRDNSRFGFPMGVPVRYPPFCPAWR